MTKEQRDEWMAELNSEVHAALVEVDPDGSKRQALANVLFAYALSAMREIHGNEAVSKHLAALSERFASGEGKTFSEIASLN